ncbi:MAG: MFS transporter [Deltaproteobacteria bacterium]|nr:MFS transporter [Deltaproteobacteria bacterium]
MAALGPESGLGGGNGTLQAAREMTGRVPVSARETKSAFYPLLSRMGLKIGAATLCRLSLNTARRFAYPFAPALGRGLNVPLSAVTSIIAVNQATGFLGFLFGPLADRFGYRGVMCAGLGMLALGMLAGGVFPYYTVVFIALFLAGLGKSIFDPALQAYVGERVPYERRALVIGVLEMSWAGSTLVGIPLIGLGMERYGWRCPFFLLGGIGLLSVLAIRFLMPGEEREGRPPRVPSAKLSRAWRLLFRERAALGTMGFAFLVSAANDNLFVIYGAWFEENFNLSVFALGLGTGIIGTAELLGETLTAAFSDRFGLKKAVITGLTLSAVGYGILPGLERTVSAALGGLFLIFLTFEFSIVTCLSLCTEILPPYRATMMASFLAAAGLGRAIGALLGGTIWKAGAGIGCSALGVERVAASLVSIHK